MNQIDQKPHAILFPYPLQGHVIPFVNLAIKLASNGFTITFVNTQSVHYQISKARLENGVEGDDLFSSARKLGLDIRDVTIYDGFPIDFDRSLNHDKYFEAILNDFGSHVDELVENLVLSNPPPNILVADTFYIWPSTIAKKYNLVNVSYWTEPALVLSVYYHLDLLRQNGHYDCIDKRQDVIDYIPGVKAIKPTDLASYLQSNDTKMVANRIIHRAIFTDVKKAEYIICNTVQQLESETIAALQEKQPVYAIGPLFSPGFTKSSVKTSLWSESDCTNWLDAKPCGSVIYVSFGSYAHTTKQNIMEIARGLVVSKVNFLWVLRPDIVSSEETDYLPIGYEEFIKDRGLIVPWCCQTAVISHPAVGGFLTHCGWNSILESIWCSVPFICFPLLTDQFTNRKIVVDDWKIGINLCDKESITRDEVSEKVKLLLRGKVAEEMKQQIKKVRKTLEDAVAINGSSQVNFTKFIDDLKSKIPKKNVVALESEAQQLNR
ncbi:UDP-glycosyltransferase 86A1-like [Nicotiana tabacum]|uniref:UDP-glycosyltransferase 86A1-like n=1 Tax=Nicotiana tabacum TaxID=4097 RepID=A0A1S4A3I9_TOBAC|nr:PREDICTED: UDP-glycosyltransferase 86A1-like [Nicotiana tabacum]